MTEGVSTGSAAQSGSPPAPRPAAGHVVAIERALAGQHLVQHAPEGPHITALVGGRPFACSGDMYAAVPSTTPGCVIAGAVIVGDCETPGESGTHRIHGLGQTKVQHLDRAVERTLMLAGFRSRCTMPCSCAATSASAIWLAIASASAIGIGSRRYDPRGGSLDQLHHERVHPADISTP